MSDAPDAAPTPSLWGGIARWVVIIACFATAAEAYLLWSATGRAGFTRYHDAARAQREALARERSVGELFEGTGLEDKTGPMERVENKFALGLLPSGGGAHLVSLVTLAGPALLAGVLALVQPLLVKRKTAHRAAPGPATAGPPEAGDS